MCQCSRASLRYSAVRRRQDIGIRAGLAYNATRIHTICFIAIPKSFLLRQKFVRLVDVDDAFPLPKTPILSLLKGPRDYDSSSSFSPSPVLHCRPSKGFHPKRQLSWRTASPRRRSEASCAPRIARFRDRGASPTSSSSMKPPSLPPPSHASFAPFTSASCRPPHARAHASRRCPP